MQRVLAVAIFASGVAVGYWLGKKSGEVRDRSPPARDEGRARDAATLTTLAVPQTRDAQCQAVNDDGGPFLDLALHTSAAEGPELFFTPRGECYHRDRHYSGMILRRHELQSRRECRTCRRAAGLV